jgi:hypothetical protein
LAGLLRVSNVGFMILHVCYCRVRNAPDIHPGLINGQRVCIANRKRIEGTVVPRLRGTRRPVAVAVGIAVGAAVTIARR